MKKIVIALDSFKGCLTSAAVSYTHLDVYKRQETEASPFQGIAYQFARSEGGGFHRIPFVGRNQRQYADGGHLYELSLIQI